MKAALCVRPRSRLHFCTSWTNTERRHRSVCGGEHTGSLVLIPAFTADPECHYYLSVALYAKSHEPPPLPPPCALSRSAHQVVLVKDGSQITRPPA